MINQKNIQRARTGASTVEFAIVLPVVLLLVFGAFDLLSAYSVYRTADQGLYRAVRKGTLPGTTDEQLLEEIDREVLRLGLEIKKMEIVNNDFQGEESVTIKMEIPLEETSWLAPMIFRNRIIKLQYTRAKEEVPDGADLDGGLLVPLPRKPGFNVKGK